MSRYFAPRIIKNASAFFIREARAYFTPKFNPSIAETGGWLDKAMYIKFLIPRVLCVAGTVYTIRGITTATIPTDAKQPAEMVWCDE